MAMEGAIARPDVPQHFMVLRDVGQRVVVKHGDQVLVDTLSAVWLMEAGKTLYPPVIYVPKTDLRTELRRETKTTHCPLKGDATYYSLEADTLVENIAWAYEAPLEFAHSINGLMAFYANKTSVEIGG